MKKKLKYINIIFFFLAVSIIEAKSQQKIKTELKTNDTILLKEIIISEDVTIDTTGLKILYVLQKVLEKPLTNKPEPCGDLDFIILYDDLSAVYFHLGCVWNTEKIYYVNKRDTLFFYPQDIGKMIKKNGMKQPAQIAKFILENGIKMHIGSIAGGFDYLVQVSSDQFRAYNKSGLITIGYFKKEERLSDRNLIYYKQVIRKK